MMTAEEIKMNNTIQPNEQTIRRMYTPPVLEEYGSLHNLTHGATPGEFDDWDIPGYSWDGEGIVGP